MTDARMQSQWLVEPAFDGLSDRAWRTMASSLMWSAGVGTDGDLPQTSLRFLHPLGVDHATAQELINAGKWEETPTGYRVLNWQKSQSLAADVEKQRERNRKNVKAYRQRANGESGESPNQPDGDDGGDVSGDDGAVVQGVPVGQARTGSSGSELKSVPTGKSQTEMAADGPALGLTESGTARVKAAFDEANSPSLSSCPSCQTAVVYPTRPCPIHSEVFA